MATARVTAAFTILLALLGLPVNLPAAGADHPHHVALVAGLAENSSKTAKFLGVEYEYRLNDSWGVGGYYEQTFDGFELEAMGLIGTYHPSGGWKIMGGAGVEGKFGSTKNKRLLRLAVAHDFYVGTASVAPLFAIDWIEDNSNVIYLGVGIGFGF